MIPPYIINPRRLHKLPDLRLLEVVKLIVVCGRQVSAHGSVVVRDDHPASACRLRGLDAVFGVHAFFADGGAKGLGILVLADAADVKNVGRGEHVLWE
jgi:hypothetical protein